MMTVIEFAIVSLVALVGAGGILVSLSLRRKNQIVPQISDDARVVLLFRGDALVDATQDALDLLGHELKGLEGALTTLEIEFPELRRALANPAGWNGQMVSQTDRGLFLKISSLHETLRFDLSGNVGSLRHHGRERAQHAKSLFHDIQQFSPQIVWQEDKTGNIIWANAAYKDLAPDLTKSPFNSFDATTHETPKKQQRVALAADDGKWFDVTTVARVDSLLHFGTDATPLVRADQDRRNFVQTLGKTFADLSIGLAIFDKKRQLAMFNPALLEMTKLPVAFLSAQPTIDTFLDRLRELRMMPEPADYTSWREKFTAVEAGAKNGTYTENWALPDGQTFRVTGRPHPDGAFAILFEDITAEVSLTRRFRSDIETGQAVLDTLNDAIAVFSGTGTMVMSNRAYSGLWSTQAELFLDHRDVRTEIATWQNSCIATSVWSEMRDFMQRIEGRKPWSDDAMLVDGRHLQCHAIPIAGGMTMVRFAIAPQMRPMIHKLMQIDPAIHVKKA